MTLAPEIKKSWTVFKLMREQSLDPPGITWTSYGDDEHLAHRNIANWAEGLPLEVTRDYAGNQYVTLRGNDSMAPRVIFGSHMGSVYHGGNFDGAAGGICGTAALHRLHWTEATTRA